MPPATHTGAVPSGERQHALLDGQEGIVQGQVVHPTGPGV